MSRSKEGFQSDEEQNNSQQANETAQNRTNLDERLGARGQTDYTGGRESYSDFPKRSTSTRGRQETRPDSPDSPASQRYDRNAGSDYENRGVTRTRYRNRGAGSNRTRSEMREGTGDAYARDYTNRGQSSE